MPTSGSMRYVHPIVTEIAGTMKETQNMNSSP